MELMDDLRSRLANRVQLTTDGHRAYLQAVEGAFGADVDHARMIKMYGPPSDPLTLVSICIFFLKLRGDHMQLKLTRSQKTGIVNVIFCLDARVAFTSEEQRNINRYRLQGQVIYTSEGARKADEGRQLAYANAKARGVEYGNVDSFLESATGKIGHGLKAAALGAISAMRLRITISSLQRGQHIECKNLDELLGAEEAIMDACTNLKGYLRTAAAFDGSEVLIDFDQDEPTIIAESTTPNPQLIAPAPLMVDEEGEPKRVTWEETPFENSPGGAMSGTNGFDAVRGLLLRYWDNPQFRPLIIGALIILTIIVFSQHIL